MIEAFTDDRRRLHVSTHEAALASFFEAQGFEVMDRFAPDLAAAYIFDRRRWNNELDDVLFDINRYTATDYGDAVAELLEGDFDPDAMIDYLAMTSRRSAENINRSTYEGVRQAVDADEDPLADLGDLFGNLATVTAGVYAESQVTSASNFGAHDAARAAEVTMKSWVQTSGDPRSAHTALHGVMVPLDATFPNGMRWPGDPAGGAENNANCRCILTFS